MNTKQPFQPHLNHYSWTGFRERITRKQLQELLLAGKPIVKTKWQPIHEGEQPKLIEWIGMWRFKHMGVGIYELWIDEVWMPVIPENDKFFKKWGSQFLIKEWKM